MKAIVNIVIIILVLLWVVMVTIYAWMVECFKKNHPACPRCKSRRTYRIKWMEMFHCEDCNLNFDGDEKR